ncbi:hypothetical protein OG542_40140 [Streptomyces violaceus]|uniref:hypothetical protein n=1 Tax=Streptomyces violaceus TaxID=1936 RepID=UPI002E23F658
MDFDRQRHRWPEGFLAAVRQGEFDTDGAERPFPLPDYFTLLCVRPAKAGGMLRLVPVDRLRALLADRPDALAVLEQDFHFDRRGDQAPGESASASC